MMLRDVFYNSYGYAKVSLSGEILDVNHTLCILLKRTKPDLLSKTFRDITHPEDLPGSERYYREMASGKVSQYVLEKRYIAGDGTPIWCRAHIRRSGDDIFALIESIEDATALMAIKASETKIGQLLSDMSSFMYVASHDLQEPLRTIVNYSEWLSEAHMQLFSTDEDSKYAIETVVRSSKRLSTLIEGMLSYYKLGFDAQELESVSMAEVLSDVRTTLNKLIEDTHAQVIGSFENCRDNLMSKTQAYRLLQNIIHNALKYSSDPPIITVNCEVYSDDNKYNLYSIADNGVGIPASQHERIFKLFTRLTTANGGLGIGLAECKKIVEFYNGRIWVESKPGFGSTFYFTLPAL